MDFRKWRVNEENVSYVSLYRSFESSCNGGMAFYYFDIKTTSSLSVSANIDPIFMDAQNPTKASDLEDLGAYEALAAGSAPLSCVCVA